MNQLPDYVKVDVFNLKASENSVLRQKAEPIKLPLKTQDRKDINTLILKFKSELEVGIGCLSLPEIGISKRAIVFHVNENYAQLVKCKPYPMTIWLNPFYEKGPGKHLGKERAWEDCYAVHDYWGPVERFKNIYYKAIEYPSFKVVEGVAYDYPARVMQHAIDHLDGILYVDICNKEELMTEADYVKKPRL